MNISLTDDIVHRDRLLKKARQLDTPDAWKEYRDEPKAAFSTIPFKIADTTELKNAMGSTESLL